MRKRKTYIATAVCMVLICAMVAGCTAAVPTTGPQNLHSDPPATTTAPTTPATTPSTPVGTQPTDPEPTVTQPTQPADPAAHYTVTVEKTDETIGVQSATMILVFNDRGDLLEYWNGNVKILYTYDSQGRILSENAYYLSGELVEQTNYTYDADGRLIQTDGFNYSPAGVNTPYVVQYSYDSNGNLTGAYLYEHGELSGGYLYDENGNLTEVYWAGDLQHEWYTYTAEGKLKSEYTELFGEPKSGSEYFYDDSGRLIRVERFTIYSGKRKELTNTFTYDENGRCIRYDMGGFQGEQSYETYTYDAAGNMLSSEYHDYDGRDTGYYWTYDEEGRITSWKSTHRQGTYLFTWTYDDDGMVTALTKEPAAFGGPCTFVYTWPETELPQTVWETVVERIAAFTGVSVYTPERYARIYN